VGCAICPAKYPAIAAGESTLGATVSEMTSGLTVLRMLLYLTSIPSGSCHSDTFNDLFSRCCVWKAREETRLAEG
jgi:hypothetical protein